MGPLETTVFASSWEAPILWQSWKMLNIVHRNIFQGWLGWTDGPCIETRPEIPFDCLGWILLLVLLVVVALFQIFGLGVSEVYWVPPSNEWVP